MNAFDAIIWTLYHSPTTRPLTLMDIDVMVIFSGLLALVSAAVATLARLLLNWQKDSNQNLLDLARAVGALSSEVVELRHDVGSYRNEQQEANAANVQMRDDLREIRSFITNRAFIQRQ